MWRRGGLRTIGVAALLALSVLAAASASASVRVKDITSLRGAGDAQLIGYGLVVGLQGSGDTLRSAPFTQQAIQSMLNRMGLDVHGEALSNRNVAAVIVTADLPLGMAVGSRFDVTVSALGDASSLMGGTLLATQLAAPNGEVLGSAQGGVSVTGFDAAGEGATLSQGVPTAGRISNGAIVAEETFAPPDQLRVVLELKNPDYNTATRIVDAINQFALQRFRQRVAFEIDSRSVELFRPKSVGLTRFMAAIGNLPVEPDIVARVVIDARTGTVVIGQDAQISTVAVTHGTLTVKIAETPTVSQPNALSQGSTVVTPNTNIAASQDGGQVAIVNGSSLRKLVDGLNRLGVKPSDIIAILQAIKTAGALQAELIVQ